MPQPRSLPRDHPAGPATLAVATASAPELSTDPVVPLPEDRAAPWWRYRALPLMLSGIVLAGLLLRCYGIATRDFWTDEAVRVAYAKLPLPLLASLISSGYEENPPSYFLLLGRVIALLGDNLVAYRLISLVSGVATIVVAYYLGRDLYGRKAGLLTALLVACSPYFIAQSQDASQYSLLGLLSALSLWLFWKAITRPTAATWALYALASAAAIYVHYYAALLVLAEAAYLALSCLVTRRPLPKRWPVGVLLLGLLLLPHLPIALIQLRAAGSSGYIGRTWRAALETLVTTVFNLGTGYRATEFGALQARSLWEQPGLVAELAIVGVVPVGIALLGVIAAWRRGGWRRTYPLWMLGSLCLAGGGLLLLSRHIVIVAILYLLLMAVGIRYQRRATAGALLALIAVIDVLSLAHFYGSPWSRSWPQDWAGAAQRIVAEARANDVVAVRAMPGGAYAFTYRVWSIAPEMVTPDRPGQAGRLPAPVPPSWEWLDQRAKILKRLYTWEIASDHQLVETTSPELAADEELTRLQQQLCGTCRLWLIFDGWPCRDCQSPAFAGLAQSMTLVEREELSPVLHLMVFAPGPVANEPGAGDATAPVSH